MLTDEEADAIRCKLAEGWRWPVLLTWRWSSYRIARSGVSESLKARPRKGEL